MSLVWYQQDLCFSKGWQASICTAASLQGEYVCCMPYIAQLENSKQLHWDCLSQVVRIEKEAAQDIRLQVKLMKACLVDQQKFCKDVEPGHMRVQVRQQL